MPLEQVYATFAKLARVQQEATDGQRQLRDGTTRRLSQVNAALAVVRPRLLAGGALDDTYEDLLDERAKLQAALAVTHR